MDILLLTTIISFIGNVTLGCYALKFGSKKAANRYFAFLVFVIAIWIMLMYFERTTNNLNVVRITMVIAALWVHGIFMFAYLFSVSQLKKWATRSATVVVIIMSMLAMSPYVFERAEIVDGRFVPLPGSAMWLFVLYSISGVGSALFFLIYSLRHKNKTQHFQTLLVIFGLSFMMAIVLSANFLGVIIFHEVRFLPLGMLSTLIFVGATTYAITRHRFLNIHVIVQQKILKFLLIFFTTIIGATIVYVVFQVTQHSLFALGVAILLTFIGTQVVVLYIAEHYLLRQRIDFSIPPKLEFDNPLVKDQLANLLHEVNVTLAERIKSVYNITLCMRDWRNSVYQSLDGRLHFSAHHALIQFLSAQSLPIASAQQMQDSTIDIGTKHEIIDLLKKRKLTHALGLKYGDQIYGIIFFTISQSTPVTIEQLSSPDWIRTMNHFAQKLETILRYDAVMQGVMSRTGSNQGIENKPSAVAERVL